MLGKRDTPAMLVSVASVTSQQSLTHLSIGGWLRPLSMQNVTISTNPLETATSDK